jgi:hypothetical protein
MTGYVFKKSRIERHVEEIGVDVRPVIEVRAERTKLSSYGMWLTDKWPSLYENIVQGPSSFHITKNFLFPGKGQIEHPTFVLTNRGLVFIFPRLLEIGELVADLDARDVVMSALDEFKKLWSQCKLVRIGKVNKFIFDCAGESALDLLSKRFTRIEVPPNGELSITVNRPTDDYNRTIKMSPVAKMEVGPDPQTVGSGVMVEVDFNNRDMEEDLSKDRRLAILHEADAYCEQGLFEFLNRGAVQ